MNKKRILPSIFLAGILAVGPLAGAVDATAAPPTVPAKSLKATSGKMRTTGYLNMRSGPSTNYRSVGVLKPNQVVEVVGVTSNGWYKLSNGNYSSGKYLKKVSSKTSTSKKTSSKKSSSKKTTSKTTSSKGNMKVTARSLNVRSGPSTKYRVKKVLHRGNVVKTVAKTSNGWYKLSDGNYVSGRYLTSTSSKTTKTSSKKTTSKKSSSKKTTSSKNYSYKRTTGRLNMRSGPSTKYSVKGVLSKGAVVKTVSKTSNGWYKLDNGRYVSGRYLTSTSSTKKSSGKSSSSSKSSSSKKVKMTINVNMSGGQSQIDRCKGVVNYLSYGILAQHDYCGGKQFYKLRVGDVVKLQGSKVRNGKYRVYSVQYGYTGKNNYDRPNPYFLQTCIGNKNKLWYLTPVD